VTAFTPEDLEALVLSLKTAALATVLNALPAILAGTWASRLGRRGKAIAEAFILLPMVLPPVVLGYALLIAFGRRSPLGHFLREGFGLQLPFTWAGAVLAAMIVSFPLFTRSVMVSMSMSDGKLEEASSVLGRGPLMTFLKITMPLAMPGIAGGAALCFARALGEFGATVAFAGSIAGKTRTLPLAIYGALQSPGGEARSLRLSLLAVGIALASMAVSSVAQSVFSAKIGKERADAA
jgi:molybdate transport system permease protein